MTDETAASAGRLVRGRCRSARTTPDLSTSDYSEFVGQVVRELG
jgi:hypothetical protein